MNTQLLDSNLNDKADYQNYLRDFLIHAIQIGEHSFVLEPEFHLMFLLVHIAKQLYGSGAGIWVIARCFIPPLLKPKLMKKEKTLGLFLWHVYGITRNWTVF